MNETQWAFEGAAIQRDDERRFEELKAIMDTVREDVVSMLGINLMPVEDSQSGLLRLPDEHEYLPLIFGIGREEVVSAILKKQEEYRIQEEVRNELDPESQESSLYPDPVRDFTPEELEAFMNAGDIEFENDPEELQESLSWGNPMMQKMLESLVVSKEDLDAENLDLEPKKARTIGQVRQDLRKKSRSKKTNQSESEEVPIRIESEGSLSNIPSKRSRSRITIETES